MKWKQLLCEKRQTPSKSASKTDLRNEFQKDYHRIICSASFRRLQDKTQVFPLDKSDFVRTRLTHSLEVASFAKSLGQTAFQLRVANKRLYNKVFFNIFYALFGKILIDISNKMSSKTSADAINNTIIII